ncbi:MAG TPA: hypothetical protein VNV37_06030 [Solirubrobacteraceae bacterium]|jgi:hypothetical protein|nr:hypothetical protein [Solirubrobacteraceae bacterium]
MQDDHEELPPRELPPRPRRRLLGTGANRVALLLIGVLLLAGGFIGGVLVEKGETPSSASGSGVAGLASRFAALRGSGGSASAGAGASGADGTGTTGAGAGGSGAGGNAAGGSAAGGGFAGRLGSLGAGATIGEVSFISGGTLYITNFEGTTVKVTTSPASTITKTVKTDLHGIHPGETVVVRGAKGSNGAVSAETISVNAAGGGGGIGALFGGGSGRGGAGAGAESGGGSGTAGLFGG